MTSTNVFFQEMLTFFGKCWLLPWVIIQFLMSMMFKPWRNFISLSLTSLGLFFLLLVVLNSSAIDFNRRTSFKSMWPETWRRHVDLFPSAKTFSIKNESTNWLWEHVVNTVHPVCWCWNNNSVFRFTKL